MKKQLLLILSFLLLVGSALHAQAYTIGTVPNPHETDTTNFVSNPDGILTSQTVSQLNEMIGSLRAETSSEVAIVALNSIGDDDIESFAVNLFEHWGIGERAHDNGLLLLLVMDIREVRFEVGYGLEGVLPDAICMRIISNYMIPEFKTGNYNAGILAGTEQAVNILRGEKFESAATTGTLQQNTSLTSILIAYLVLAAICILWMMVAAENVSKNVRYTNNLARYSALKKKRSTMNVLFIIVLPVVLFFFFSSSLSPVQIIGVPLTVIPANIIVSGLLTKIRRKSFACDECNGEMVFVPGNEKLQYLSASQQVEEKLHSVEYDVFLCSQNQKTAVFPLDIPTSPYKRCPNCSTKAFGVQNRAIVVKATYTHGGVERITYKCQYCHYQKDEDRNTPRLERTASTAVGVLGTLAGSSRGGGGGSFGGGRSGGGGATGRW